MQQSQVLFLKGLAVVEFDSLLKKWKDNQVIIVSDAELAQSKPHTCKTLKHWTKVQQYSLNVEDRRILETDQCLSDIHINAAQSQLHSQFNSIKGLQSTLKQYSV